MTNLNIDNAENMRNRAKMVAEIAEDADRRQRSRFIALVLLKAGGNERGIMAAMTALGAD